MYRNDDRDCTPDFKCEECGKECTVTEESFDYNGTHCTHGQAGTHHTGEYSSDCCGGGFEEVED